MEISELNRTIQRLRSEIDGVKKQVPSDTQNGVTLGTWGETFLILSLAVFTKAVLPSLFPLGTMPASRI